MQLTKKLFRLGSTKVSWRLCHEPRSFPCKDRSHNHAWSKEEDLECEELTLKALDLDANENYVDCGEIQVKKIHSLFSEAYYDSRKYETKAEAKWEEKEDGKENRKNVVLVENKDDADKIDGIVNNLNGTESDKGTKK